MSHPTPTATLFRTDAIPATGTGHAMRCLALAQALAVHGKSSRFLMTGVPPLLAQRISREGFSIEPHDRILGSDADAEATVDAARRIGAGWIVLDGYAFTDAYIGILQSSGIPTLVIDDLGKLSRYDCDIVVNQNLHAEPALYPSVAPSTRLLLGTRYMMLRHEFWRYRASRGTARAGNPRILVSMGGSDPENHASRAIDALERLAGRGLKATVVVGAANPRSEMLRRRAQESAADITVLHNVEDMPALMREADLAVAAAGTTVWELAYMGVPMLVGSTVEAERVLARRLAEHKGCVYVGDFRDCAPEQLADAIESLIEDSALRRDLAAAAGTLVDGKGGERIVAAMQHAAQEEVTHAA
ncbi:MAG TPA: UDP-2,4-diacetamido-2,4,6-trideoxy-beta-L-altropyranose hydrolase [Stellaceae bacterium]|nr:UDP-2,4-diacetamido-2,4,6-trideoxy-beta-L-altropyranose hydrolase [Stellaceae bacterium]